MSDRGFAISCSVALHLLVFGLMVFHWSSEPELRRAPKIPPHVMARVMEETHRAPAQRVDKPEQKPQQPKVEKKPQPKPEPKKPEPKPQPKPKPEPKPEPKPKPKVEKPKAQKPKVEKPKVEKPQPKPKVPDFKQPSMEQLMAEEQLEMANEGQAEKPGTGEADSKIKEETASYVDAIRTSVEQRWRVPGNFRNRTDLSVQVRIELIPGGEVSSVSVVKSSGYPHFDDSLVAAVKLASPLPVPKGEEFEQFRNFIITFNPGEAQ